jgi:diguanylate cyclase (GGDEF)-like protein/PAS domain S-box-containing protein
MSIFSEKLLIEPDYGVIIHRDFKPLYTDDNYAHFYGYQGAKDILSLTSILELISPSEHHNAMSAYSNIMSGKQHPGARTYKNIDKEGNELTVLAIDNVVEWQGAPAMQVIIIDLSYQFEMQRHLELSEERYRVLVDGSIQGILVHDNFTPLFCNNAYAQMFGFKDTQDLLENQSILPLIAPEYHDKSCKENKVLLAGETKVIKTETKGIRKNGSTVWLSLLSRTVLWNGDKATQVTAMDITEQHLLRERLEHRANYDVLTNLLTRRAFNELLAEEFVYAQQHSHPLCCVLIDIDNFKYINDQYGHHSGDKVLESFASTSKKNLRESDFIGRWGGDEFVLILPRTELDQAVMIAERLCQDISTLNVSIDSDNLHFSVSLGVSALSDKIVSVEALLYAADKALYGAKNEGKNCVAIASV